MSIRIRENFTIYSVFYALFNDIIFINSARDRKFRTSLYGNLCRYNIYLVAIAFNSRPCAYELFLKSGGDSLMGKERDQTVLQYLFTLTSWTFHQWEKILFSNRDSELEHLVIRKKKKISSL